MLKENFYNYLDTLLKEKSYTEKRHTIDLLNSILQDYYNDLEKSYTTCPFCAKTFPSSSFIFHENTEIRKNVFLDTPSDPNDFDVVLGDVRYLVKYIECPHCHKIKEQSKKAVKVLKTYLGELT